MSIRGTVISLCLGAAIAGAQLHAPAASLAHGRSSSAQGLTTKIKRAYAWAQPHLISRSRDGKQFSLSIYQSGKPVDLSSGIGAKLLNLYITELPGQAQYFLTTYSVAQSGSPVWQYIYTPGTKRLERLHVISARSSTFTTWYISLKGIAQAAKTGHWPSNGVNRK